MPKTIRYIGTQNYWPEVAYTGRPTRWMPGMADECPDNVANALLATGLFRGVLQSVYLDSVTRQAVDAAGNAIGGGAPIVISGVPAVGNTLTATISPGWRNSGGNWTRDGANIAGATALTYPLVSADNDKDVTYASSNIPYTPPAVRIGAAMPVAPGAPTIGTATAGDGVVNVLFTAPASTGGSPILEYQAELSNTNSATGAGSPIPVASANGAAVTGRVRARNAVDWGPWSANSNSVTPSAGATVPGAPAAPTATAGDGTVSLAFVAPSTGGSPILEYGALLSNGNTNTGNPTGSPVSVPSANGAAVTGQVRARNAIGWGPYSEPSNSVTPQAAAPVLRQAAPYDLRLTGTQNNGVTGRVALGNVSIGTEGDFTIFIQTEHRTAADNMGGGLLSIGDQSDNIFSASNSLVLNFNGNTGATGNYWNDQGFGGLLQLTAQDGAGNTATSRYPVNTMAPGTQRVWPLIGQSVIANAGAFNHGFAIICRAGTLELWDIDLAAGPRLIDSGPGLTSARDDTVQGAWTSILNKPMFLGFVNLVSPPTIGGTVRTTNWGGPIGQVVIWNGGAMTPQQLELIGAGTDARDVVPMNASRGDRYWPGSEISGQMQELIADQHGTIVGTGASFVSTARPLYEPESATVAIPRGGVRQADVGGTTTNLVLWGERRGVGTSDVQVRLLTTSAASPTPAAGDIVIDWTTVAAGISAGAWVGTLPNVPHAQGGTSGDQYRVEVRSKKADGSWTTPKRMIGALALGDGVVIMGQSIMQQMSDLSGPSRTVPGSVTNRMHVFKRFCPVNSRGRSLASYQSGWYSAQSTYTAAWGESLFMELLATKTGRRAYVANFAQSGSAIGFWRSAASNWMRRVVRFIQENRPRFIVFNNGHGDAGMSQAQRFAAQDDILAVVDAAVQSAPGGPWAYTYLVLHVTNDFTTLGGLDSIRSHDIAWVDARKAEGKPVDFLTSVMDMAVTGDGTHEDINTSGAGVLAERFATDIANRLGFGTGGGIGGRITSGTWSWAGGTLTVTLPISGGVAPHVTRAGGNPSGFQLSLSGGGWVAPTTSSLSDSVVTLTYAVGSAPSTVDVSYLGGYPGSTLNAGATTTTQAGTNEALYDTRTGLVSGRPGMAVMPITYGNRLRLTAA